MSEPPSRRPSPTPNPASRARRIGGRPGPRPGPSPVPRDQPHSANESTPREQSVHPKQSVPPEESSASGESGTAPAAAPAASPGALETERDSSTRRLPLRWLPAALLSLAALVLLGFIAVASHGVYWAKPDASAGARAEKQEQVLAAAKKCFATINTYDYRKLSGLVAKDLPCTTGKFSSDLKTALTKTIIAQAPKAKAVQTAQVNRAGVISLSPDGTQWTTLIYGQLVQSNSSTAKSSPRTDVFGAVVTMDDVRGEWLISKVAFDTGALGGS